MGEFQTNRGNGRFNFSPNITNNPVTNTGGHVMASFLLGAPSLIEQDYLLASDVGMRSTEYGAYIADDWRATQKLTLNLGLRYELDTPFTEVDNLWASFDPNTATVLVAGRNGVSRSAGVKTFTKAFAPRLGFAYQIAQRTVVRGGAGLFWNTPGNGGAALRLHRHVPFGPIYSFNPGTQFVTRRVSDGFPTIPPLDLALADNPSGSVIGVDPNYQPGYAEQFDLTVEQELPAAMLLKVSYVGNIGKHLDTTFNLNQAVPGTGAVNNRRPFFAVRPALADVNWAVSDGTASYHALQFSAQKRLTHGLNGLLSYTWGHGVDTVGQSFGGGADGPLPQDPLNRLASHGNSPFDMRHRLTIAWNYALPGGWQINGINIFQTGLPFTPTLNATTINTGTGQRPDRHRRRHAVGPDRGPLVRHLGVYDAGDNSPMAMRAGIFCTGPAASISTFRCSKNSASRRTRGSSSALKSSMRSTRRSSISRMRRSARRRQARSRASSARRGRFNSVGSFSSDARIGRLEMGGLEDCWQIADSGLAD